MCWGGRPRRGGRPGPRGGRRWSRAGAAHRIAAARRPVSGGASAFGLPSRGPEAFPAVTFCEPNIRPASTPGDHWRAGHSPDAGIPGARLSLAHAPSFLRLTDARRPPAGWSSTDGQPHRPPRYDRQPLQAPRLRLPLQRDLRRAARLLGLWPARRRDEEQHQAAVVEVDGPGARRHRRARLQRHPGPGGLGGERPRDRVRRPAHRVPVLPQAVPGRPSDRGLRGEARAPAGRGPGPDHLPELRHQGRVHRAADVQRAAAHVPRRHRG